MKISTLNSLCKRIDQRRSVVERMFVCFLTAHQYTRVIIVPIKFLINNKIIQSGKTTSEESNGPHKIEDHLLKNHLSSTCTGIIND